MTSLGVMIKRLGGMVDTVDLKPRENQFVKDIVHLTDDGRNTSELTDRQIKWIEDLHGRNFA